MTVRLTPRRQVAGLAALGLTLALLPGTTPATAGSIDPQPGSPNSGDSLFPQQGNGGYDVSHYDVTLTWTPDGEITATAVITATAKHDLSAFNLDLRGLTVDSATVDGITAGDVHAGTELTVTPSQPVAAGVEFVAQVDYHGSPETLTDPDGSEDGWFVTSDGATVLSEPIGSMTWLPNNNTPRDKATYDITVTAPQTRTVVSNGRLVDMQRTGPTRTWHWRESDQMASYLATVSIGRYDVVKGRTGSGTQIRSYIDPKIGGKGMAAKIPGVIDYWEKKFGPYPFTSAGMIVDDVFSGFALEVQTRPVFPNVPDMATFVHEFAHQWFGDSVTPRDWSDIWLNEGFATYAEWIWEARTRKGAPQRNFQDTYDQNGPGSSFWNIPVADPGDGSRLFGDAVYTKGAMALQAIKLRMGGDAFATLLKRWPTVHRESNASTAQLKAMAERISGRQLDHVFEVWLYGDFKPPGY